MRRMLSAFIDWGGL